MLRIIITALVLLSVTTTAFAADPIKIQQDLDRDGRLETIVAQEIYDESTPDTTYREALETKLSILRPDGTSVAEATVRNGRPIIETANLTANGRRQLVVWTQGGAHYTNLTVFDYQNGKLRELFANGSACEVKVDFKSSIPAISIGRVNRADTDWNYAASKPLWNVYNWDGKTFTFNTKKSTAPEISEEEEVQGYVQAIVGSTSNDDR